MWLGTKRCSSKELAARRERVREVRDRTAEGSGNVAAHDR